MVFRLERTAKAPKLQIPHFRKYTLICNGILQNIYRIFMDGGRIKWYNHNEKLSCEEGHA